MTSKDYRQIRDYLTNSDICDFAKRLCDVNNFDPVKSYPQTVDSKVMNSAARKRLYADRAIDRIRVALFLGATKDEMLRLTSYLIVLMRSIDDSLDYTKCSLEMDIPTLEKKYCQEELLALNVSFEDLKKVIEIRDKDFYGVVIKNEDR